MPETNWSKEGPVLSLSVKVVVRTRGVDIGASSVAVAKVRRAGMVWTCGRKTFNGEVHVLPCRQR